MTNDIRRKNSHLLSRFVFLGVFGLTILLIFWLKQGNPEESQTGVIAGNYEKGKATLVEYSDFQCPACALYYPVLKQLKAELGDKLIFEYKYFPLMQIHKNANLAARAAEAAKIQGKFWEMHDILFEKQNEWAGSDQALSLFTAYAVGLSLNQETFLNDIDSDAVKDKVNEDYQDGFKSGVKGTPTFFLNGKKITNPRGYDDFKATLEKQIQQ